MTDLGCKRCKSSEVKAAQGTHLDNHFKKLDDKSFTAHLKIVRDANTEMSLRVR